MKRRPVASRAVALKKAMSEDRIFSRIDE